MGLSDKTTNYRSCRVKRYPCGVIEILAASRSFFRDGELDDSFARPVRSTIGGKKKPSKSANVERACRRARAKLREYALANEWDWFVTLTLDGSKIERYNIDEIMKKVRNWLSNQVKRDDLRYVLVPEYHKKGGIHFHGLFRFGSLRAVDSGHRDSSGHCIYNLEGWPYGFSTAIQLYGDFERAVNYVCKYIGKGVIDAPIGGRWYYHGGKLDKAVVDYYDISPDELRQLCPGGHDFVISSIGVNCYLVVSHDCEILPPGVD